MRFSGHKCIPTFIISSSPVSALSTWLVIFPWSFGLALFAEMWLQCSVVRLFPAFAVVQLHTRFILLMILFWSDCIHSDSVLTAFSPFIAPVPWPSMIFLCFFISICVHLFSISRGLGVPLFSASFSQFPQKTSVFSWLATSPKTDWPHLSLPLYFSSDCEAC